MGTYLLLPFMTLVEKRSRRTSLFLTLPILHSVSCFNNSPSTETYLTLQHSPDVTHTLHKSIEIELFVGMHGGSVYCQVFPLSASLSSRVKVHPLETHALSKDDLG